MQPSYCAAGVDVSKAFLDVAWANQPKGQKVQRVPNTDRGCHRIGLQMKQQQVNLVAVESTGGYERRLVRCLQAMDVPVAVLQPSLVRHHAKASRVLAKTDAIDARLIADYAQAHRPVPRATHDVATAELRAISERRDQVVEDRTREKNRLEACDSKAIAAQIRRSITRLDKQVQTLDKQLDQAIKADALLASKNQMLQKVKGVGKGCASALLIYLPELGKANRQQIAALAGLAPYACESGARRKKRTIFGGRARLRKALYMSAMSATRSNEAIRPIYKRLVDAGKEKKVAQVACARKLLVYLNAMMAQFDQETALNPTEGQSPSGGKSMAGA